MKSFLDIIIIFLLNYSIFSQVPNWENLGLKDTIISDIVFDDSGSIYLSASPTAVLKSTDNGKSWIPKTNGITSSTGTSLDIDSKGNIYLTAFGGVFKTTNSGENWIRIAQELTNLEFYLIKVIGDDYLFLSNFDGIFRSTDYGTTWDSTDYTYWGATELGINSKGIMFAGNFTASWFSIYKSTNLGMNWILSSKLPAFAMLFSPNGDVFAGVGSNPIFDSDIYKSSDDGLTWERTNVFSSTNQNFQDLKLDRNNNFYAIVSGDYNGMYFSGDMGKTWKYFGLSEYDGDLNCLSIDVNGNVYVGSFNNGIFRMEKTTPVELISFNSEIENNCIILKWVTASEINNYGFEIERKENNNKWQSIGYVKGNGTNAERHIYQYRDENIKSGEYFYRLKQIDFNGTFKYSSEIESYIKNQFKFNLEQNYPNPFNPKTEIEFTLNEPSKVNLKVYDLLGNLVTTLLDDYRNVGMYKLEFKGENLSSGIYFYIIKVNGKTKSRSMVLQK